MFLAKQTTFIRQDLSLVYSIAETYPNFVRFFRSGSRALRQGKDSLQVEIHGALFGFPISWQGDGLKRQDRYIRFIQTRGLLKGLVAGWSFLSVGSDTKVTIMTYFNKGWLTPLGERYFGKYVVEKVSRGILQELKAQSELEQKFSQGDSFLKKRNALSEMV